MNKDGRIFPLPGVSKTIHYKTKGIVGKEAKKTYKKSKYIPRLLSCYRSCEVFITGAGNSKKM